MEDCHGNGPNILHDYEPLMHIINLQIFNFVYALNQLSPVQIDPKILRIPLIHLQGNLILNVGHIDVFDHLLLGRSDKCFLLIEICGWIFEGYAMDSRFVIKESRGSFVRQE